MVGSLLAGCGGGGDDPVPTATKRSELEQPGESGTLDAKACRLLPPPVVAGALGVAGTKLEAESNDSLDLTICQWHGGPVRNVKLLVDSAPRAQLRYYNLLAEQHEFHNADPARKARQIKGVGEDSAYGGAGAWWTSSAARPRSPAPAATAAGGPAGPGSR